MPRQIESTGPPVGPNRPYMFLSRRPPRSCRLEENVRRTLALNPELRARWLGDEACGDFLRANFGGALLAAFRGERRGSYRGDICRSA
eukprot:6382179-Pyramimonas_sp.AAC.1